MGFTVEGLEAEGAFLSCSPPWCMAQHRRYGLPNISPGTFLALSSRKAGLAGAVGPSRGGARA